MHRRQFLQQSVVGGAGLAIGASARAQSPIAQPPERISSATLAVGDEVVERGVDDLRRALESGELTTRTLAQAYLRRIDAVDRQGAALNSVIEINPDALDIAERLDIERKAGKVRGPMHGMPVLIKDNIDTADAMKTTAGSLALLDARPKADAGVVARLRAAGALVLGKTNLSEWANFRSEHSTSGWSARGGLTHNAYALDRNGCGSSTGSGVAASASLCAVAVGTETDGSIVCPSSINGLVGIKPTVGLVGRSGIIPISATQDTAGPMARTVADAAALLQVLAGPDPRDAATNGQKLAKDYREYLQADALQGKRIGVMRNFFGFDARVDALMEDAIKALEAGGATIVDKTDLTTRGQLWGSEFTVLLYEFKAGLQTYFGTLGPEAPMKTLADVIAFNESHAKEEMPYFGQDLFLKAQAKGPLTDKAYLSAKAKAARLSRTEGLDRIFALKKVDAVLAPSSGPAWLTDLVNGDYGAGGSSGPAAVSGYPNITVPAGFVRGLPIGVSFIGPAWSEPTLIGIAYAYEQRTKLRRPPQFLPSALV